MKQEDFIVGKWHKSFHFPNTLAKFKTFDRRNYFVGTEWIDKEGYYMNKEFHSSSWNRAVEADMNEVSKYLPKGHPDKNMAPQYEIY